MPFHYLNFTFFKGIVQRSGYLANAASHGNTFFGPVYGLYDDWRILIAFRFGSPAHHLVEGKYLPGGKLIIVYFFGGQIDVVTLDSPLFSNFVV